MRPNIHEVVVSIFIVFIKKKKKKNVTLYIFMSGKKCNYIVIINLLLSTLFLKNVENDF